MTRDEHLAWCKRRALEYVDHGNLLQAWASMGSDMNKHPETRNHPGLELGMTLMISGDLSRRDAMRRFIEGFQ
jgi:hypothetical protein